MAQHQSPTALRTDIADLENELERLFNQPGAVPPGKRGELMERLRLLKAKAHFSGAES